MAKDFETEVFEEELDFDEKEISVEVVEKKSLWTKTKEKVSAIGDMTLKDAGKGILKVGAAIGGTVLLVGGAMKLLGNNEDDVDIIEFYDEEGNLEGFTVTEAEEVETNE